MKRFAAFVLAVSAGPLAGAGELDNSGLASSSGVSAPAVAFSDFTDFATWQSAYGAPITRIGFDAFSAGTLVTNQYSGEGVTFTDGDDEVVEDALFVEDGVGLRGDGRIHISLSQPARAVGAFFPGAMAIEVFESEGGPGIHASGDFGGSGGGHFGGVVGDTDFSFVEIRDWVDDSVFIDDLVIGFAPPEGAITGCIVVTGIPLTLNVVALLQRDEPRQLALTDENGCYRFDDAVDGKWFSIYILGTRFPPIPPAELAGSP